MPPKLTPQSLMPGRDQLQQVLRSVRAWLDVITDEAEVSVPEALGFLFLRIRKEFAPEQMTPNPHERDPDSN